MRVNGVGTSAQMDGSLSHASLGLLPSVVRDRVLLLLAVAAVLNPLGHQRIRILRAPLRRTLHLTVLQNRTFVVQVVGRSRVSVVGLVVRTSVGVFQLHTRDVVFRLLDFQVQFRVSVDLSDVLGLRRATLRHIIVSV